MDDKFTTTAFDLPGYKIVRNLGVARGVTVRSRSLAGNFIISLQLLFGGNITLFTQLCILTRQEAYELMIQQAKKLGANAVIGIRYDSTEISAGVAECLCYGTAVFVEPK
ncbi:YbjQ family protein [Geitlerinema sp. PCC 7407]|uniref:YbjQ family protein n=1 Tax=Geitlerinema sp. PCC 7407 TaxID=1173025 RepID=UPI00029FEA71|nr:protein of unknown function DUF74 [Geitlerinema sp. PCC 7407]